MVHTYILSFIEGILTFISPCILPLLPVYLSYLAGTATHGKDLKRLAQLGNTAAFILGFTLVFVAMGAAATSVGFFLREHIVTFRKLSAIIMIVFGLFFFGLLKLPLLNKTIKFEYVSEKRGLVPSVVFGMVFAFGWSPCTGPFLGTALLLASSSETVLKGIILLLLYSAGLGIPFMLASLVFQRLREATGWFARYGEIIRYVSGVVLIITGVLTYLNANKY